MLSCDSFTTFVVTLVLCAVVSGAPCLNDASQEDCNGHTAGFDHFFDFDQEVPLPLNHPEASLAANIAANDFIHVGVTVSKQAFTDTPIEYDPAADLSVQDIDFEGFSAYRTEEPIPASAAESAKESKETRPTYHSGQIENTRNMTISGFSMLSLPVTIGLIGAGAAGVGISRIRRRRRQ